MKRSIIAILAVALVVPLAACNTEERVEGEYTATSTMERTEERTGFDDDTTTATRELGEDIEEGARDAGEATGTAIEEAGRELREHSQPGDQP
jgi:hypothetical protein